MIRVINGSRCNTKTAKTIGRKPLLEWANNQDCYVSAELMETPKGKMFIFIDRSGVPFNSYKPWEDESEIFDATDRRITEWRFDEDDYLTDRI